MTTEWNCCALDTNLVAAAELMWRNGGGALVVMDDGKLAGIITDRDICIALVGCSRPAAEIAVGDVATLEVRTCTSGDDVHTVLGMMRRAKVRRLPGQ